MKFRFIRAISTLTAAVFVIAIFVIGLAAGLTVVSLNHSSSSSTSHHSSSSTTDSSSDFTTTLLLNSSSSSQNSTTLQSNSSSSSPASFVYIASNNGPDQFQQTSIVSTLNNNTGQLGWVYESAQDDSIFTVSDNQLALVKNNIRGTPTSITFDSKNNVAYMTYVIQDGPSGLIAISGNSIVNTPVSQNLQSSPQNVGYDPHYDYLYVSYYPQPMEPSTKVGIAIFNPNNGTQLAFIPTNSQPTGYVYDTSNGDMFAIVPFTGGQNTPSGVTIYDIKGLNVVSSYNVNYVDRVTNMVYNLSNGLLYLTQQMGDIAVVNPANQSQAYFMQSRIVNAMVYDLQNQNVYAFVNGDILTISGTSIVATTLIAYNVASAFYDTRYNNILAFY